MQTERPRAAAVEGLESRRMMALAAAAQLRLVSTDTSGTVPAYHYDITVLNTGSTPVASFWFAWNPGKNYLPTAPANAGNPAHWSHVFTGPGKSPDGTG